MRRFIIKTVVFLLPLLVITFTMEILLRTIPNDYSYKRKYLDKHSNEIETLILGSSHSFFGFNPSFFSSKTFNVAYVSQSLNFDYKILQKYQNEFHNLNTVILPISYFTLYSTLEDGTESWRIKNYVIYYDMNIANSFIDYSEVLSNNSKINLERLYTNYIQNNTNQNISCSKLGWGTTYHSERAKDLVETGKTAAKRHTRDDIHSVNNNTVFEDNILLLNSIIKWCEERHINVLLLTLPAFETYRQNINLEQYKTTVETANKIASQHKNCIYINLFDDNNFIAKDFYDADHLSEIGAEKLSKQINTKVNELK